MPVNLGLVEEYLQNIRRAAERGRNSAEPVKANSNFIATCDHIEDLANQAINYLTKDKHD